MLWALAGSLTMLTGCSSSLDRDLVAATQAGRYGQARVKLQQDLSQDRSDRAYILGRLRLLILTLADGQPDAAEITANEMFSLLATQGINSDRTVSSVVFNERVKIWKGEPFEQAFGYAYVAIQKAQRGEWDNARAAANNSLFLLKDFASNERRNGRDADLSTEEIARRAAERDAKQRGAGDSYLDNGYVASKTDFALGYLLSGLASRSLGRDQEASDNFNAAAEANAGIKPLCDALRTGVYNTVFIVDCGPGPEKVSYGTDNAFARFEPRQSSDTRGLSVALRGSNGVESSSVFPWVTDVNMMARNHMWNNLEDVRSAKSLLGTALLVGGAAVAISSDDDQARTAGLIAAGVGLLLKASASADTRHCEFLPQRVYVAPTNITQAGTSITLDPGNGSSQITLTDLAPPRGGVGAALQLRYVRLPIRGPQAWATSGATLYANEYRTENVEGASLPFIMGGRCVCRPTAEVMERYRRAGNLTDLTASDLENIYREEGIRLSVEDQKGGSAKHILEGGDSLVCPLPGTTGYQRLFGQIHRPWQPRGAALRDYLEKHPALRPEPVKAGP